MSKKTNSYKNSIEELEAIIQKIETGEVDIDELSTLVKKASDLISTCKTKLRNTEVELNQLLDNSDG